MLVLVVTLGILAAAALFAFLWLRRTVPDGEESRLEFDPAQLPGIYYRRQPSGGATTFVAGEIVQMTGHTSAEFDAGLVRLEDLIVEEDRLQVVRAVSEAMQEGGTYAIEYRLRSRLGDMHWVYDRGHVRTGRPGEMACEGFLVDITTRKLYEQRMREQEAMRRREQQEIMRIATSAAVTEGRLADAAKLICEVAANQLLVERCSIWLLSADDRTLTTVQTYERTPRRYSTGSTITASDFPRYFAALRNERAIDAVDAANDARTSEFASGYLFRYEIVSLLDASIRIAGKVRGVVCIESVRQRRQWSGEEMAFAGELADQMAAALQNHARRNDATERKRLEAELIQAQKMEAVGHLTAGIAHDFNNIITAASGYASLARQYARRDPDMLNACLTRIDDAIRRSRVLARQLMKFGSTSPATVTRIDLNEHLTQTMEFMRSVIPSSVEIDSTFSGTPLTALFDADQLDQVILNLALNAADAMDNQGQLHIATDVLSTRDGHCDACGQQFEGDFSVIRITDTGSGIPDGIRDRIFEPFFTTKKEGRGTGLGLPMVSRLVHEYGGHLMVASEPGRGTTFSLCMPFTEAPRTQAAAPSAGTSPAPAPAVSVIVVDDDVAAGTFVAELLLSRGYPAKLFTSPSEALKHVRAHPAEVRLVVTDYSMPEMDGVTLARELYETDEHLAVLLVSGYGADINLADFGRHGIRAMFGKPIETERLLTAVRDVLAEKA